MGIFPRQQQMNQHDNGQHALLDHFGERHLRDVVAKHPNIHPQAEYREGGRDRRAEKE